MKPSPLKEEIRDLQSPQSQGKVTNMAGLRWAVLHQSLSSGGGEDDTVTDFNAEGDIAATPDCENI
jgi:hypothetical protein